MKPILLLLLVATSALAAAPPNILFMLSDDQAWSGLSCQMHPDVPDSKSSVVQTPNIARLAEQGMRFSAAYAPAPVCSPTRISLQTGRNPAALGWTKAAPPEQGHRLIEGDNRKSIRDDEITIGQMLKSAGYATAHYGKWHLAGGGPAAHGYDESDGDTGNQDAAPHLPPNPVDIFGMGSRAVDFMKRSQAARKPFFIQMSYNALHYPENATPALLEKYRKLAAGGNDKEIGRAAIAEDLDRGVGELQAKLDAMGLSKNTIVIYMSDNGGSNRRTLNGGKGDVWEGGIRVPLIIRGPGIAPNSWCHQRVVGYDLFPTFSRWAGVKAPLPKQLEGGDITHLLGVVPNLIEELHVLLSHRSFVEPVHEARHGIAALVTEIGGGEPLKLGLGSLVINDRELLHRVARGVRAEGDLAANPVRALSCDRALGELVAQPDLEVGPGQARLGLPARDEELAPLLAELVRHLLCHE